MGNATRQLAEATPPEVDVVVMETTYGDRMHRPLEPSVEELYDAVAETFDALTSDHSYQQPVSKAEAISRIEASTGVQFDPQVVNAFLEIREELPAS